MKAHVPTGFAVMFLETDEAYMKPIEVAQLTDAQVAWFSRIGRNEQASILEGRPAHIFSLSDRETLCEFNMQNFHLSDDMVNGLAESLLPAVQEYFENKENVAEFENEQRNKQNNP